ncbi:MAG: FtsW/RodA/SpoVE family cell cycle protein [Lachnospiraceae bacterium]|nr:FtsW/RodA/SpoVE family cell cycle protein [Lachnospiraceae bacterium]
MELYVITFSRYFIALFAVLYTLECFLAFRHEDEAARKWIYIRQTVFSFLFHFCAFLTMYFKTGRLDILFLFAFQVIALYTLIALYGMFYPEANRLLLNNMCFLMAVGFIMLMRLNYDKAVRQFCIIAVSSVIGLFVPYLLPKWKRWDLLTYILSVLGVLVLGAVLVLGSVTNGSKLSFSIVGVTFQPSELIKVLFVLAIAGILTMSTSFTQICISAIVAGAHVLILVFSRDLGGALIYSIAYIALVYVATANPLYPAGGLLAGGIASYGAYRIFSHVQVRIRAWLDPWSDIDATGYQITQSLFAIGCGGMFGLGLYHGSPNSIPHVETDFIFSALAEELGTIVGICLILVCVSCFLMLMKVAMGMREIFPRLCIVGFAVTYLIQVFLTIGGGMKLIPLTGVTLPLVSYGGSSVLGTILMFSFVQGFIVIGEKRKNGFAEKKQKEES